MITNNAVRVSSEEMMINETPKRKRVSAFCKPFTYVFGIKLYINKSDIHIFINNKFHIYYEK